MKLSPATVTLLKNFSNINNNLTIQPGNTLSTINFPAKNIMASAEVPEMFETQFGIYSLPDFLGAISLFQDPELEFNSKYVSIKENNNSIKFYAADPSLLTQVPRIKNLDGSDITFRLSKTALQQTLRAAAILHVTDFSVVGDAENVTIVVGDKSNSTSNSFNSIIGETDKTFRINLKIENLKVLPDDYDVAIVSQKIFHMKSANNPVQYWIAVETDSAVGG